MTRYETELLALLENAQGMKLGLWDACRERGRFYTPTPQGAFPKLELRRCFDNSLEIARRYGLPYVEGLAAIFARSTAGSTPTRGRRGTPPTLTCSTRCSNSPPIS